MQAVKDLQRIEKLGHGQGAGVHGEDPPVALARTAAPQSPDRLHPARARLLPSAGAGFVVALCGDMQRMPGLGKTPAFMNIDIDERADRRTLLTVDADHNAESRGARRGLSKRRPPAELT